jgi:hypothetical protein
MNKKMMFKKMVLIISVLALLALYLPVISSCTPARVFGDLTICSAIDPETAEPTEEKNVFNVDDEKICATIKAGGVKADDIKRFSLTNLETGEIVFDKSEPYFTELEGYVEGYFYIETEKMTGDSILLEPGDYEASFYHKGELIDKADFEVLAPEAQILEVSIASEVDEQTKAPLNTTNKFKADAIFYASIRTDYHIAGDYFEAKWYSEDTGESITTRIDIEENYFYENYIAFQLSSDDPWNPGNYSVEIYHNGDIEGIYKFEVLSSEQEIAEESIYINQSYGFGFIVPDGWEVYEEDDGYLALDIIYGSGDIIVSIEFIVSLPEEAIPEEEYGASAREAFNDANDEEWSLADEFSGEFVNKNGIYYEEYQQVLIDEDGNELSMVIDFFKGSESTYIMFSIIGEDYYEMYNEIYAIIVDSFDFI